MRVKAINKKIEAAREHEIRTHSLENHLREVLSQPGGDSSESNVANLVNIAHSYVTYAPKLMQEAMSAAKNAGIEAEMRVMMNELQAYWALEDDFVPDSSCGLGGVLDDAYASLALVQAVSDWCKATSGRPLLRDDVTNANQLIRRILGEPLATQIDQRVGITIGQAMMQKFMECVINSGFQIPSVSDPALGGVSMDEYVNIQLGAAGVI